MALTASAYTGSAWRGVIMLAFHTVMPVTAGLLSGLPVKITTRSIPTHLNALVAEATSGVLLDTFDSIPLYTLTTGTQNVLHCTYPDGTVVNVACTQE